MKTATVVSAAVLVSALAAGCGSKPAPTVPGAAVSHPPAVSVSGRFTNTGNRKLAAKEARWLMSKVPVPRGAKRIRSAPSWLRGAAMGTPAVASLIDSKRIWRLTMPVGQAIAWLQAHHPRGLSQDGSATGSGPGQAGFTGYSYAGRSSRAWDSAQLEIEVTQAGRTAVLRADALVVWLDPVPYRDNGAGRRLHLSVAGGCPATDKSIVGVTNQGADLRRRLLPSGAPTAGLECRYYGMNGRPFRLRSQTRLTRPAAIAVARSMQRLPLSHAVGAVVNCPMDDASFEIIALNYQGRPAVDLWVKLNGCRLVANGFIEAGLY